MYLELPLVAENMLCAASFILKEHFKKIKVNNYVNHMSYSRWIVIKFNTNDLRILDYLDVLHVNIE